MKTIIKNFCRLLIIAALFVPFSIIAQTHSITITINSDGMGTVAVTGTGVTETGTNTYEAPDGTEVTLTASPNLGFNFQNIKQGRYTRASEPTRSYTFTLSADVTFVANFEAAPTSYTVTSQVIPAGAGIISPNNTTVYEGDATFTAEANPGYNFLRWVLADGTTIACPTCTEASYTLYINSDTTVRALFEEVLTPVNITTTVNDPTYGSIQITNNTHPGLTT